MASSPPPDFCTTVSECSGSLAPALLASTDLDPTQGEGSARVWTGTSTTRSVGGLAGTIFAGFHQMQPIKDNRTGEESITRRWMKKSRNTADNAVHRNRPRSEHISSGKRSENGSGIHDGSADALQLHMAPEKMAV